MTRLKGFKKNRHELARPVKYMVEFSSGHLEIIEATSQRNAQVLASDLEFDYGRFKGAWRVDKIN